MNDKPDESILAPMESPPSPPPDRPFLVWARRLLACNPFYLASAAMLLYGIGRASLDSPVMDKHSVQLATNFASLQCYEILLVVTAIWLARRKIWYDSTLLVGLDNLLLIVPFILLSQAVYFGRSIAWMLAAFAVLLIGLRFATLHTRFPSLNLPKQLLGPGALVLLVNIGLPMIFKRVHDTLPSDLDAWSSSSWYIVLPVLMASALLLPRARLWSDSIPEKSWLPFGLVVLWVGVTATHVWCLGYVYDLDLPPGAVAPLLWALCWTTWLRASDFGPETAPRWGNALLVAPFVASFAGISADSVAPAFALGMFNAAAYAMVLWRKGIQPLTLHLLLLTLAQWVAFMPPEIMAQFPVDLDRDRCVWGGVAFWIILVSCLSRNAISGVVGSFTLMVAILVVGRGDTSMHQAFQGGLVFLLLHSMRWEDDADPARKGLRNITAVLWVIHSVVWTRMEGDGVVILPIALASLLLLAWTVAVALMGWRVSRAIPLAAGLVLVSQPIQFVAELALKCSLGALSLVGSLVLFAAGTLLAVKREKWGLKKWE